MEDDGIGPNYDDITKQVKDIAYGPNLDTAVWDLLEHTTVDELREKCSYSLRNGSVISGTLKDISSCTAAPRVLVTIKTANGKNEHLTGRLYGSPSNLGVTLDQVLEIK